MPPHLKKLADDDGHFHATDAPVELDHHTMLTAFVALNVAGVQKGAAFR